MNTSILCLAFVIFSHVLLSAQTDKGGNTWYFGNKAGLRFEKDGPVTLTDGQMNTVEGCATLSDKDGSLLFYTDGITVWGKDHKPLPNGTELRGNASSTQSGVIVPDPADAMQYYVFTVDVMGGKAGFCYSKVDLRKNNGIGEVTTKNVPIRIMVTERLTAVRHQNGRDTWLVVHGIGDEAFYAYLLTASGVAAQPTVSMVGTKHDGGEDATIGAMKSSADGSQIAVAIKSKKIVDLFDFNNATGILTNPIVLFPGDDGLTYGIEFSPSGRYLYLSTGSAKNVMQYDLLAGSAQAIQQSGIKIGTTESWCGSLQLGPDRRIYVSGFDLDYLSRIDQPDIAGTECGFVVNAISVKPGRSQLGLPTFNQSYFIQEKFTSDAGTFTGKVERGKTFILTKILFESGKADLEPTSFTELDNVAKVLRTKPELSIMLTGNTDNVGNKSDNLDLSLRRANTVRDYLIKKGIQAERLTTKGLGMANPISTNSTEEGRRLNRRVEMKVL
ncbi:MAG TPA: OmpA family protein [Candidatus Didemnitutus sp.]|nr:OmpA family protein [Candidatus Didemnitutus sp.]